VLTHSVVCLPCPAVRVAWVDHVTNKQQNVAYIPVIISPALKVLNRREQLTVRRCNSIDIIVQW